MVDFNPKKHKKGVQLYEIQSKLVDGMVITTYVKSATPYEEAAKTPWYYVVEG